MWRNSGECVCESSSSTILLISQSSRIDLPVLHSLILGRTTEGPGQIAAPILGTTTANNTTEAAAATALSFHLAVVDVVVVDIYRHRYHYFQLRLHKHTHKHAEHTQKP